MKNIEAKICEMRNIILNNNLRLIRQCKNKPLDENIKYTDKEERLVKEYNYYIKFIKKLKKHINNAQNTIIRVFDNNQNKLLCLIVYFDINNMEQFGDINIRVIEPNIKETYMNCYYYNSEDNGRLYIKEFRAGKPRCGHGRIVLQNLDYIVNEINREIDKYNHYNEEIKLGTIKYTEGIAIPTKSIIDQSCLNSIYRKYGFDVDDKNRIIKKFKFI
jgi:hypothetical protein